MKEFHKKDYPEFASWEWQTYTGHSHTTIQAFLDAHRDAEFFIGTDSQNYRKKKRVCVFTTVLIAYHRGKGGQIIMHTDTTPYMEHLRQRLMLEAMRSLETAWFIDGLIKPTTPICIHLDVNANLRYKSSQYKDELVALIMAQGYRAAHKPYAWASSSVADSKT